ncbi:MAG: caspase family protein [Kiritimatiellia bacterium]|nr:caspase family protein [Kiritimatiellia bacterium]
MFTKRFSRILFPALCAIFYCLSAPHLLAIAIESGQWYTDSLDTNQISEMATVYDFFADTNDTVIIRLGHTAHDPYPDFTIHNPNGSTATWTQVSVSEYHLSVTTNDWFATDPRNNGWYDFVCSIPVGTTTMTYNCSMLRTPNIPLSYQDLDVGTLELGQSKVGTINVSADLDAGFFAVTNSRTTMQVRMGQMNYFLVPNIQIYDPNGVLVTNDFPTDYRSEITAVLTNQGIYTVVCSDKFNADGQYALTMIQIPGALSGSDTDIGPIISGEKKTGKINQAGDLDIASFSTVSGDVVTITMQDVDVDLNPILEFYGPTGTRLVRTTDVFETCAVISNYPIVSNGVYSIVCKDKEDRYNVSYTLEMGFMPGSPSLLNLPDPPTSISASQGSYSNHIDVTWNAAGGATGYDLWRSYTTNSVVQICTNLLTTTYSDYDVTTGLNYYYKVKSRNTYGTSTNFSPSAEGYCGISVVSANRRVLLVGIDNYSSSYGPSPLTTCTNDVNGMRDIFFLGDPSNRWSVTNMIWYTDRQATKSTIQNALHNLATASSAGDIVVYMHSSHGGTSGGYDTYICTYDADYTDADLAGDLTRFNSETKVVVIIDACYSGGMFQFKDIPPPPWLFAEKTMSHFRRIRAAQLQSQGLAVPKDLGQNIAFMTACDYDELSYCSDFYSRYIGYLIQGCNVQSVDANSSGQYNFLELHNYAATQSMAETPTQHAQSFHPSLLENITARAVGTNPVVITYIKYNDFDGDGVSDLAVYNTSTGAWRIGSVHRWLVLLWDIAWGGPEYRPINGDYDGDRTTDLAVYNETRGIWSIASLSRWAVIVPSASFGGPGLTPVSGDYNGDGIYDSALYQDPEGFWYIVTSTGVQLVWGVSLSGTGFVPVSGDYDGDRISDVALYNTSVGYWYIIAMNGSAITWGTPWGGSMMLPVSGDYDGDGYSDLAVYEQSTGLWYIWSLKRSALIANAISFGGPGYTPVPGDYNGDGNTDLAVYQESTGNWYLRTVSGSQSATIPLGGPGYIPILPAW